MSLKGSKVPCIKNNFFCVITRRLVKIEDYKPTFQDLLLVLFSGLSKKKKKGINSKSWNVGF